jgi:hypothetical protein
MALAIKWRSGDDLADLPQQVRCSCSDGHQRFQPLRLFVVHVDFPRFQICCVTLQELIPPAGQRPCGHTSSRESVSGSSPRSTRRTAPYLRFADHRPRRHAALAAPPVALRVPSGALRMVLSLRSILGRGSDVRFWAGKLRSHLPLEAFSKRSIMVT